MEIIRVQTLAGQQCMNVFYYRNDIMTVDGGAALDEAIAEFSTLINNVIANLQSQDVTEIYTRAQWVHPTRYVARYGIPALTEGVQVGTSLPSGAAVVVRRRSDLANRSSRGRIFVPGIPISNTLNSKMLPGWMTTNADDLAATVLVGLDLVASGLFMEPVIWSYSDRNNADPCVTANVDDVLRYQRRREVGRGI